MRASRNPLFAAADGRRAVKHVVAFCMALSTMLILVSGAVNRNVAARSASSEVASSFTASAERWNVPRALLMAIGYVESHWEQRDGTPSLDGGYGIMHLTEGDGGTLTAASKLSGLSEESIRFSAAANIDAAAALLADWARSEETVPKGTDGEVPAIWASALRRYSGATDLSVQDSYVAEVFRVIQEGATATLASGELVMLSPGKVEGHLDPPRLSPNSDDYGPALWVPAHSNNFSVGRQYGPLNFVVIHSTEGSYTSAISWFQNGNARVSAHYVIRSSDGQITQMVRNANTAYHAGNWDYNVRSIGVEHEGYVNQQGWFTEVMYQSSSALVRDVTERYGIKKDRAHLIAHAEVPGATHTDPGPNWNWGHYMSLVRRDSARVALVDNTSSGFSPIPATIDPQHYWWVYGGGYGGSNTYMTTSVADPQSSVNSGTWRTSIPASGYYDVYAFVPYVDNNTPDTASARYKVHAADGVRSATTSQQAITNVGSGSWAQLGKFYFNAGDEGRVYLDDFTGESGRSVWFDAVMWIPSLTGGAPPPPAPTSTPAPLPTYTPLPQPTWTPGACGLRFSDLPDSHWAYSYVSYLYCRNVISGYADGTFRPGEGSTRGQFAKMLALASGWTLYNPYWPTFNDVSPGSTFFEYIETAALRGVVGGYPGGSFRPGNPVTRAQAAKMLVLAREWTLTYPAIPSFVDVSSSHWAYGYIETAAQHGVIGGYADRTFRPDLSVTRAQLAKTITLTVQAAMPGPQHTPVLPRLKADERSPVTPTRKTPPLP